MRLILALSALLFLGCEGPQRPRWMGAGHAQPQRGGTLVIHHEDDVRGLDPHVSFDEISGTGLRLMFDRLLDYDRDGKMIPAIAREMPTISADGTQYTFHLRNDVRFHNGRLLTAEDVRWSLEHLLAPRTGSPGVPFYTSIEGVEEFHRGDAPHIRGITVLDPLTIQFKLNAPNHTILDALAMHFAAPVPRENYEAHPTDVSRHPIGTGPFKLAAWEPNVRVTFVRNPHYWRSGKPYLDGVVYELNVIRETAFLRFRNGDMDHVHHFTPADRLWLHQSRAWAPYRMDTPRADLWGVIMNCEMAPFDNVHVRRAVSMAIDRNRWNQARNFALAPHGHPLPPMLLPAGHTLAEQRLNIDAAKDEMRLAGHPNGLSQPVTMWNTVGSAGRAYGELIQADLARIGITVQLKTVSFPTYLEQTGKPHTAPMLLGGWDRDFMDPASFLDPLFHSRSATATDSSNRAFYKNPTLDALLDQAHRTVDANARGALYARANDILVNDAPWAFALSNLMVDAWQPYVHGYQNHPVWGMEYREVWLDLPRKRFAMRQMRERGMPWSVANLDAWRLR